MGVALSKSGANASLAIGENIFSITVTAENLINSETYTIIVYRNTPSHNNNANLRRLTVSEGILSPSFNPNTLQYDVNVANNVSEITITAATVAQNATITGDGLKSLSEGTNIFNIIVTAEDRQTVKTYTINIRRATEGASTNANLRSLSTSYGELTPQFTPNNTQYTLNVEDYISRVTIFASTDDPGATLVGTGEKFLEDGENVYNINVIAEDGQTTKVYKVTIIRTVDIADHSINSVNIYPNPATDIINIDLKGLSGDIPIKIYNIQGQIFYEAKHIGGKIYDISISSLPSGPYIISLNGQSYKLNKVN